MVCSLAVGLLLLGTLPSWAEPAPPARIFSQVPPSEPVFVSSKKPLLPPAADLAKPLPPFGQIKSPLIQPAQKVDTQPAADIASPVEAYKEQILLEPPSPEALFGRLDSEKMLEQRMRQQAMQRQPPDTVQFPERPSLPKEQYKGRAFAPQAIMAEPNFVGYNRLYFEEKNAERYGWDLGFIQPVISVLYFYKDAAFLPYHFMTRPCQRYETSAGYCLPGDPVPYILYAPEISVPGTLLEGAAVIGLLAAIP